METFSNTIVICSGVMTLTNFALLWIRPLREKLLGEKQMKEGQKCLLRSEMLRTYYRHREEETIRQYEYESFVYQYEAYKALGGNSFIDKIYAEVKTWEVLS